MAKSSNLSQGPRQLTPDSLLQTASVPPKMRVVHSATLFKGTSTRLLSNDGSQTRVH
jgi:hemin uptake protein HemP